MKKATGIKGIMLVAVSLGVMTFGGTVQASEGKSALLTANENRVVAVGEGNVLYGASQYKTNEAYAVLELVNKQREKVGAKPLVMDQKLLDAANIRAKDIVKSFSHERPNGDSCFSVYEKNGSLGENIAYGYNSAASVMKGWMNSSGHKHNILDSEFQSIGISCYYSGGNYYWVQCFSSADAIPVNLKADSDSGSSSGNNSNTTSDNANVQQPQNSTNNGGAETNTTASNNISNTKLTNVSIRSKKKALTVSWKKEQGATGYQIQISTKKSFAKKSTTSYNVKESKTRYTVKKLKGKRLKSKKKYYVRVRAVGMNQKNEKIVGKWKTLSKKTK